MSSIYRYGVFHRPDGMHHISGYDRATASVHVSPPLVSFDSEAGIGPTADGLKYMLESDFALDMHLGWTWKFHRIANDSPRCTNVMPLVAL